MPWRYSTTLASSGRGLWATRGAATWPCISWSPSPTGSWASSASTRWQAARIDAIEARRRAGEVTEADLVERSELVWPLYFADPATAPPHPGGRIGVECSTGTNASISEHFGRGTLADGLPAARLPALFVHGERDPLPMSSSCEAAALIPGAVVETIPGCGHFPWMERTGEIRRRVAAFLAE